jgi:hypothetical protein
MESPQSAARQPRRRWDPVPEAAVEKAYGDACDWATKAEAAAECAHERSEEARAHMESMAAKLEESTLAFNAAVEASRTAFRASVVALCEEKAALMAKAAAEHALMAVRRANE